MCNVDAVDDDWGICDAECAGCDDFCRVNDLGLCIECAGKLERDLIRQRDWDYVASAYALPDKTREELYRAVIKQHGPKLELIAKESLSSEKAGRRPRKQRRKRRR